MQGSKNKNMGYKVLLTFLSFKDGVVVIFGVLGVFLGSFFSLGHEFDCCLGLGSS